jgi:tRNA A-37 threonylcarbamoyl transferase component Bud32
VPDHAKKSDRLKAALADRYRIERELGVGGMATVYLAEDLKHKRKVAIKVLRPDLAATLGPERFLREIEIAAQLQHPNILPLLDSGEADSFLYYVMPYIEGQSLRDKIAKEGELPIGEAVRVLRDVVDALTAAHAHGVVHRDIKPENILLSGRHALVTDFGVAKAVSEATGRAQLTTAGVALGTPAYMAPEQASADPHLDHRVDIYAVGAVAYELFTGRPVFMGTTPQMVLAAHVTEAPQPVTKRRETVPRALESAVMRCLEKKPADRWQSAEELLPQFEALATPRGGMTPTDTRPVRTAMSRSRGLRIGVAAAVVIAVIGAVLLFPRGPGGGFDPNRVLVLAYLDESRLEESKALGRMAQDYIIQVLTDAGFAEVVDPLTALAVSQNVAAAGMAAGPGAMLALAAEAGAGTVVSGTYYAEGDSLHIQTRISDARDGRLLGTVGPIVGSGGAPRELVARLGQEVVVALAPLLDRELGSWEPAAQPATYDAYEAYSEGLEAYMRDDSDAEVARHFERAAAADPTFSRAILWAAQSYFLLRLYSHNVSYGAKAESLLAPLVESRGQLSRYERCRLDFVTAMGEWDNPAMYDAARCMARAAPGSDDARREVALTALRLNRPREAIELLRELDPDRGLMRQWQAYWEYLTEAYHMASDYEAELEAARQGRQRFPENGGIHRAEVRALAALGHLDDVAAHIEATRSSPFRETLGGYLALVAISLRAHGHRATAPEFFDESIAWYQSRPFDPEACSATRCWLGLWGLPLRAGLAWVLYQAERWDDVLPLAHELAEAYPHNVNYLALLGQEAAARGDREKALRISEELRLCDRRRCTGFGWPAAPTVHRAGIAALLGDRDGAVALLRQVLGVNFFYGSWLHNDVTFASLHDYPPFQELIRPKG